MSRKYQGGDAFRRRPPAMKYSRRWRFQLEGLLRAGEQARRGLAERLLAGVLLAVAVAGAVLIPRLLVGPPPGHELGVGAPSMTVPPVVLAPGLPGHKPKPPTAATPRGGATHVTAVPSTGSSPAATPTHPVVTRPAKPKPPRARTQPPAPPQPDTQPPTAQGPLAAPLAPRVTTCDGTFSGTGRDVVVPGGATCVLTDGTTIAHDLTVAPGGTLIDPAVTVGHDLVAHSPAGISIHGDSIGHDLRIDGLTGSAGIQNQICSTAVGHDLVVQGGLSAAGSFDIGGNCPDGGNTVGHDLVVLGNANAVAVAGNSVGHALRVEGVQQTKPRPKAPGPPQEPRPPKPPKPQHKSKAPRPATPQEPAKPPKPSKPAKPHDQPTQSEPAKPPKPPKPQDQPKPSRPAKPHDQPKPPKPPKPAKQPDQPKPPKPAKPPKPPKPATPEPPEQNGNGNGHGPKS